MSLSHASRFLSCSEGSSGAGSADAGDCFRCRRHVSCLPSLINIGVQKAGTGELQKWLSVHPAVKVHGGEAHFFDRAPLPKTCSASHSASLRLRYAKFLWERRALSEDAVRGKLVYEKTPAYFDRATPQLVACTVPSARLLVVLRLPEARAYSAYAMCQREFDLAWCKPPFATTLRGVLRPGDNRTGPTLDRRALRRKRKLGRVLLMGHYSAYVSRWFDAFGPAQLRVLWLEQFKRDPFACLRAVEAYAGLPAHDFRAVARRNSAGYWVVGESKSDSASTSAAVASQTPALSLPSATDRLAAAAQREALATLRAHYAPWQRRLGLLLQATNTSLLDQPLPT